MEGAAVVLVSGGLDSAVTAAVARRECARCVALTIDYGQRHRREIESARAVAASLGLARHVVLPLDLRAIGGSALTADVAVPKDRDEAAMASGIPPTYVPARNIVFLSLALGLAEVEGAGAVYLGVNAVDYSGYPDCRPEFIAAFERMARVGTRAGVEGAGVRVAAPIIGLSKAQIITLGRTLGVDLGLTHSCYDPETDGRPCGRCDSCRIRAAGFAAAGVPDPALNPPRRS